MADISDLEKFEDELVELDDQFNKLNLSLDDRYDEVPMDDDRIKELGIVNRYITLLFEAWKTFKRSEKNARAKKKEMGESHTPNGELLKEREKTTIPRFTEEEIAEAKDEIKELMKDAEGEELEILKTDLECVSTINKRIDRMNKTHEASDDDIFALQDLMEYLPSAVHTIFFYLKAMKML